MWRSSNTIANTVYRFVGGAGVPPMPDGWYPHEPGAPFYELDWVFLHEHPHILERHWELAWREGRV